MENTKKLWNAVYIIKIIVNQGINFFLFCHMVREDCSRWIKDLIYQDILNTYPFKEKTRRIETGIRKHCRN